MYKRCVITDEISQDLARAIAMARHFQLDAVELRNVWGRRVDQLSAADLDRAAGMIRDAGLAVAAIAAPCFKCDLGNAEQYTEHIGILRTAIRAAHVFGTPLVRTFTFWKDRPLDEAYQGILSAFAEPIAIAAGEGMTLAVENEASTFIATGEQTARFLTDLGSPGRAGDLGPGQRLLRRAARAGVPGRVRGCARPDGTRAPEGLRDEP